MQLPVLQGCAIVGLRNSTDGLTGGVVSVSESRQAHSPCHDVSPSRRAQTRAFHHRLCRGLGVQQTSSPRSELEAVDYGTYLLAGLEADFRSVLIAFDRRLPPGCVFSGLTAARLHGMDADDGGLIEITAPRGVSIRPRQGVSVRDAVMNPSDVTQLGAAPANHIRTHMLRPRSLSAAD